MKKYLVLDYETFSECDLKKAGAFEYSVHKSTEVLCVSYTIGTKEELKTMPIYTWSPHSKKINNEIHLRVLATALKDPSIDLVAHNALFEQVITSNVLSRYTDIDVKHIPINRWHCTAAMSRAVGIPGKLELAGAALNLFQQKDKEGHRLMLKYCKPKKPSKKDPSTRYNDPEEIQRLIEYCEQDIRSEVDLFLKLPEMPLIEREIWLLDQKMNLEGFAVDRSLVKGALKLIARETKDMDSEFKKLSGGKVESARQRNEVLKLLKDKGMVLPNLQSKTVKDLLAEGKVQGDIKRILEIRDSISKSSTAKYAAFEMRSRHDGRARDNTIYFGAHTGRQSGTGLQPQNLFKTVVPQEDLEAAIPLIQRADFHAIKALFPRPMDLYASALRSCIVSKEGHTLDVGDFATIEVRVLFWLCGNTKGLEAMAQGRDLYIEMAAYIYKVDVQLLYEKVKANDPKAKKMRQLGKTVVLGAGFGIGAKKFYMSCLQQGIDISEAMAKVAVDTYRNVHGRVPFFWKNLEKGAIMAVKSPGKRFKIGFLIWEKKGDFLTVELPIGRKLHYFKPEVKTEAGLYGEVQKLTYMNFNSITKKFERQTSWGGVLTENVVQAVARDFLMEGLLRMDRSGNHAPVLAVHDEIVCERRNGVSSVETFEKLMAVVPKWGAGIPIKVEAWSEDRYRK
jgi:DNA polymerase bacteriophage-type